MKIKLFEKKKKICRTGLHFSVLEPITAQEHLMDFLPQDSELLPFKNPSSLVILLQIHGAFYSLITTKSHGQSHIVLQQQTGISVQALIKQ